MRVRTCSRVRDRAAQALGACFSPTSLGVALNVLRAGKVLGTKTGQLIVASAMLDDVIALVRFSAFGLELGERSWWRWR